MRRSLAVVSLFGLVAVACTSGSADPDGSAGPTSPEDAAADPASPEGATVATSVPPGSPREPIRAESVGCEPGEFHWQQSGCEPATSIPLDQIISGGPPPDGIPPIDEPVYEPVADAAEWLGATSPVMVVDVEGDVRAYPLAILTWHEIVNDTVGG